MIPYIARGIAAVGFALSMSAIWTSFVDDSTYWNFFGARHAIGIAMLVLAIIAAIGIVLAFALRLHELDQIWVMAGLAVGGMYLWFPIGAIGGGHGGELEAGAWLGFAAFGVFAVAGILNAIPVSVFAGRPGPGSAAWTDTTSA